MSGRANHDQYCCYICSFNAKWREYKYYLVQRGGGLDLAAMQVHMPMHLPPLLPTCICAVFPVLKLSVACLSRYV